MILQAKPVVLEKPEDVIASVLRGAAVAAAQTLKERGAAVGAPTKGAKEPAPGPDAADSPPAALANGHASAPEQPVCPSHHACLSWVPFGANLQQLLTHVPVDLSAL